MPAVSASLPLPTLSVMMPPELAVEPSPATVRLPVAAVVLFQRMPLAPPLAEIEVKLNAPPSTLIFPRCRGPNSLQMSFCQFCGARLIGGAGCPAIHAAERREVALDRLEPR